MMFRSAISLAVFRLRLTKCDPARTNIVATTIEVSDELRWIDHAVRRLVSSVGGLGSKFV